MIAATTILTITTDLATAVAMGTLLSGLILLYNMGNSYVKEYQVDCTGLPHKIKSFTIEGALFFGVAENIAKTMLVKSAGADIVIINLMNAPVIDATGVIILGKIKEMFERAGKKLILTGLKADTYEKLMKLDIVDPEEKEVNLGRIGDALVYAKGLTV
ncbi:MAG: sodium-independent anion transporter [Clostridia bacterium]|nr:sodium-independent anion transporter [Clostridia bacterium]